MKQTPQIQIKLSIHFQKQVLSSSFANECKMCFSQKENGILYVKQAISSIHEKVLHFFLSS